MAQHFGLEVLIRPYEMGVARQPMLSEPMRRSVANAMPSTASACTAGTGQAVMLPQAEASLVLVFNNGVLTHALMDPQASIRAGVSSQLGYRGIRCPASSCWHVHCLAAHVIGLWHSVAR